MAYITEPIGALPSEVSQLSACGMGPCLFSLHLFFLFVYPPIRKKSCLREQCQMDWQCKCRTNVRGTIPQMCPPASAIVHVQRLCEIEAQVLLQLVRILWATCNSRFSLLGGFAHPCIALHTRRCIEATRRASYAGRLQFLAFRGGLACAGASIGRVHLWLDVA